MTTFPFDAFIRLVEFDQQMKQLNLQIDKEEEALAQLQKQKTLLLQDLEQLKQSVHVMQKAVDAKELDMKVLDDRSNTLKHKIDTLSNPKEYSSLRKEIDTIHTQQNEMEDILVGAWHQLEVAQKALQQRSEAIALDCEKADAEVAKKIAHIDELCEKHETEILGRAKKLETIPAEWLEKYEGMHVRIDDPVVPVADGSCSGCFYSISQQDLARLKRRALLQCNSCYRFLYDPSMLEQGLQKSEAQD